MKKLMILLCMLWMGNVTACGNVQEISSEITPADEQIQIYESIRNQGSLTCNPVPLQEESDIADEYTSATDFMGRNLDEITCQTVPVQEETIPPEIGHRDKDAELLAMIEAQIQAVKDNDFEEYRSSFDMDFAIESYIAEGHEEAIDELDESMLDYFYDLCENMPELQELDTIQGSVTDWMIEDMTMLENGVRADCTAVIKETPYIIEFELYASGDQFIALLNAPVRIAD